MTGSLMGTLLAGGAAGLAGSAAVGRQAALVAALATAPVKDAPTDAAFFRDDGLLDARLKLHARLIDEIDLSKLDKLDEKEMRRQVRKLVGDGFPLAFDANNCYTSGGAIRVGRAAGGGSA